MGAAASTNGARELRNLHTAITASGISRLNTTISDVDQSNHLIRIERLAERLLIREQLMVPIDAVEPGHKTTLMYAAAGAGGEECLAVVKLLKKYTKTKVVLAEIKDSFISVLTHNTEDDAVKPWAVARSFGFFSRFCSLLSEQKYQIHRGASVRRVLRWLRRNCRR